MPAGRECQRLAGRLNQQYASGRLKFHLGSKEVARTLLSARLCMHLDWHSADRSVRATRYS